MLGWPLLRFQSADEVVSDCGELTHWLFPIGWGEGAGCCEDFKEMKSDLLSTNSPPPFCDLKVCPCAFFGFIQVFSNLSDAGSRVRVHSRISRMDWRSAWMILLIWERVVLYGGMMTITLPIGRVSTPFSAIAAQIRMPA